MKTLALCGVLAAIAAPVGAAEIRPVSGAPDTFQTTVPAGDLDLSRPAGADVLVRRVHHAAEQVCGPQPSGDAKLKLRFRRCVATAMNDAVLRLDAPLVTARYLNTVSPARIAAR